MSRAGKKIEKEARWIDLKEGNLIIYVYLHPDPAIHQRFTIKREFVEGRKAPHFIIVDKLGVASGQFCERLRDAQAAVKKRLLMEAENPDIRTSILNELARGNIEHAFTHMLDLIDERIDEVREEAEENLNDLRRSIRRI